MFEDRGNSGERVDALVDELDAGIDPDGILVIREKRALRIVGLVICLLLGSIPSAALIAIAFSDNAGKERTAVIICAAFVLFFGICALSLLNRIVFSTYYYIAATNTQLLRRSGTRRLETVPLARVATFESRGGSLIAAFDSGRQTTLMKDAYAPESLSKLARKLSVWKNAPPTERPRVLRAVDVNDLLRRRRLGSRMILGGLASAVICIGLVTLAVIRPRFAGVGTMISLFGAFLSIGQVLAGLIVRWQARHSNMPDPRDDA